MNSTSDILTSIRSAQEQDALKTRTLTLKLLDTLLIAVRVIGSAAKAGNVQCQEGMKEIDILWTSKK